MENLRFRSCWSGGYNLPEEFAVFPPVVLDSFSATWTLEGGNNLLAHYNTCIKGSQRE